MFRGLDVILAYLVIFLVTVVWLGFRMIRDGLLLVLADVLDLLVLCQRCRLCRRLTW